MTALVAAAGVGLTSQSASAQLKFTYTSSIQVQNLTGSLATIAITYYNDTGVAGTFNDTVPASGSKAYFPLQGIAAGFSGSAIVSSDQPVASVVNVVGNTDKVYASYIGFSAGSTTSALPLLMKGNFGYDTWFQVQNAGSALANVTVNYSDGTTGTAKIQPGSSARFVQSTETHSLTVFGATVTSDQPIVVAAIEENANTMFAYNGFTSGTTNPSMPLINANNFSYVTGVTMQNSGTQATDVTVSYTPSAAGTACTEKQTLAAGQSSTFALGIFGTGPIPAGTVTNCAINSTFVGSAKVTVNTTSQPLSAIVNQLLPGKNGEAYGGFDATKATDTVVAPLIMDRNSGFFTGMNIVNVGTAATTVNCTFTDATYTINKTLQPDQAFTDVQANKIKDGYVGGATCTASAGGKIVGVINQLGPSGSADQLLVYEGINK